MSRFIKFLQRLCGPADGRHELKQASFWEVSNVTRLSVLATRLEVAGRTKSRRTGLLGRSELKREEGLWIIPCEAVHTFGMRFPIDLIFLDKKNRVKKQLRSVTPWRISVCFSAHSVLELAQGTILDTQTKPGDAIAFKRLS